LKHQHYASARQWCIDSPSQETISNHDFLFSSLTRFFLLLLSFVYQNRIIEGSVGFERIYG
jgi:hypothetical protein